MNILLTQTFKRAVKKFHTQEKMVIEKVIQQIAEEPRVGDLKTGDLAGVRVFKFFIHHQQILLAYTYDKDAATLVMLMLATHENFYQNLKHSLKK